MGGQVNCSVITPVECAQRVDKLTVLHAGGDYSTEKVKRTGSIHTDTKGRLWRYRVLFTVWLYTAPVAIHSRNIQTNIVDGSIVSR